LTVLDAVRVDPSGAQAVGIQLHGKALARFLLAPQQLDGYRMLQARDRLWRQITGGATGAGARTRLVHWLVSEARHLKVRVRGIHGFSLASALLLAE
jgi:hypothetical protein